MHLIWNVISSLCSEFTYFFHHLILFWPNGHSRIIRQRQWTWQCNRLSGLLWERKFRHQTRQSLVLAQWKVKASWVKIIFTAMWKCSAKYIWGSLWTWETFANPTPTPVHTARSALTTLGRPFMNPDWSTGKSCQGTVAVIFCPLGIPHSQSGTTRPPSGVNNRLQGTSLAASYPWRFMEIAEGAGSTTRHWAPQSKAGSIGPAISKLAGPRMCSRQTGKSTCQREAAEYTRLCTLFKTIGHRTVANNWRHKRANMRGVYNLLTIGAILCIL